METGALIVIVWILCGLATGWISQQKGRGGIDGFIVGVILGPLGLILALVSKPIRPSAPEPGWMQGAVTTPSQGASAFCPRCGTAREGAFAYCRSCGLRFAG